jgi:phage terminase large subunit-like protein
MTARRGDPGPARAVRFINNLPHTKGAWAGHPFALRPWQERIVRRLFRTRRDGNREIRTALLMLPRKNGKTELAAAIALYGLFGDGEMGAEVYSAAADKDQAALCFNVAAEMVRHERVLLAQCDIIDSQKRIVHRPSGSFYRAISAEAYSKHGFNASMVVYDELHAAPTRELYDVLSTSMGARVNPLMLVISTAGFDRHSILWELYSHAVRVRERPNLDPSFLPVLYEAPAAANWRSVRTWRTANPALGDFRSIDDMRIAARRASEIPAQENVFRRLFLNQWTEQSSRWIGLADWDACAVEHSFAAGEATTRPDWHGRRCYVGLDLSTTTDLTALTAVFPGPDNTFDVLCQSFLPADHLADRMRRDRVPYDQWAADGRIVLTPGNVIDYDQVRATLRQWDEQFDMHAIGYDPWNATDLIERLKAQDGYTCLPVRQGFGAMSSPTKSLERAVLGRQLRHDGDPVLRWNVSNVSVDTDTAGNVRPSKRVSAGRIDGVVALIIAIDMMERHAPTPPPHYQIFTYGGPP